MLWLHFIKQHPEYQEQRNLSQLYINRWLAPETDKRVLKCNLGEIENNSVTVIQTPRFRTPYTHKYYIVLDNIHQHSRHESVQYRLMGKLKLSIQAITSSAIPKHRFFIFFFYLDRTPVAMTEFHSSSSLVFWLLLLLFGELVSHATTGEKPTFIMLNHLTLWKQQVVIIFLL